MWQFSPFQIQTHFWNIYHFISNALLNGASEIFMFRIFYHTLFQCSYKRHFYHEILHVAHSLFLHWILPDNFKYYKQNDLVDSYEISYVYPFKPDFLTFCYNPQNHTQSKPLNPRDWIIIFNELLLNGVSYYRILLKITYSPKPSIEIYDLFSYGFLNVFKIDFGNQTS